jgi:hypothetical protein
MHKQDNSYKKSHIKANILQYIELLGISKYNFYKKTGITRGILDQDTGISEENIAKFLAYFNNINIEWLILGKGSMFKEDAIKDGAQLSAKINQNTSILSEPYAKIKKKENSDENQPPEICSNCVALNNTLKATEKALQHAEKALEHAESEIESKKDIITLLTEKIGELNKKIGNLERSRDGGKGKSV